MPLHKKSGLTKIISGNTPAPLPPRKSPVWKGPEVDGITFSLLSRFLVCRERFRVLVIDGLKPIPRFDSRMEFGNMWHVCEEHFALGKDWIPHLVRYTKECIKKYPMDQEQVDKWFNVCFIQFPMYVDYWNNHKDVKARESVVAEFVFNVPYQLPSGRVVRLRGKWDSVDVIKRKIWLQENKTKGNPNEILIRRQLTFDLQTMLYLVTIDKARCDTAIKTPLWQLHPMKIGGVRYNVIRRPLSGGKGTIVQHKPTKKNPSGESREEYFARLSDIIGESKNEFFFRWNIGVDEDDIQKFKERCLDPILENLCYWYDQAVGKDTREDRPPSNWQHPFGVRNILDEGGATDLDDYLVTGSRVGLTQVDNLFPEL